MTPSAFARFHLKNLFAKVNAVYGSTDYYSNKLIYINCISIHSQSTMQICSDIVVRKRRTNDVKNKGTADTSYSRICEDQSGAAAIVMPTLLSTPMLITTTRMETVRNPPFNYHQHPRAILTDTGEKCTVLPDTRPRRQ